MNAVARRYRITPRSAGRIFALRLLCGRGMIIGEGNQNSMLLFQLAYDGEACSAASAVCASLISGEPPQYDASGLIEITDILCRESRSRRAHLGVDFGASALSRWPKGDGHYL